MACESAEISVRINPTSTSEAWMNSYPRSSSADECEVYSNPTFSSPSSLAYFRTPSPPRISLVLPKSYPCEETSAYLEEECDLIWKQNHDHTHAPHNAPSLSKMLDPFLAPKVGLSALFIHARNLCFSIICSDLCSF